MRVRSSGHRRARVRVLLPDADDVLELNSAIFARSKILETFAFKAADAVRVAAAEALEVDVFLSCDDRLCRLAKRRRAELHVKVANPLAWLKEIGHETDA